MQRIIPVLVTLFLAVPTARASAQLLAAKEGPIVYGHHHVNATNPAEHKKFWADTLGGTVIKVGTDGREIIRMPNVLIFMREQAAKGGTKGSVHDHIGLSVPNLRQTLDKVKANGYRNITAADALPGQKVNGDIVELGTGAVSALAYILGPDDVKVEVLEMKAQKEPVKLHHIHFFGHQQAEMRDWYVKVFGATAATTANPNFITANLPGVGLNFSATTTPTAATAGRALDHIGFEVKNLADFLKRLEAQGIKPSVTLRRVDALDVSIAFIVDPWGTNIELSEGLDKIQ
ncbi:MAG TPA: VOC family protein [Vicinamibacterales bacterium]|nr:VOC family protein [Vicinamibacterales bacterium]